MSGDDKEDHSDDDLDLYGDDAAVAPKKTVSKEDGSGSSGDEPMDEGLESGDDDNDDDDDDEDDEDSESVWRMATAMEEKPRLTAL